MTAKEYEHHDAASPEPVAYFDPQKREFYWARPTQIDAPTTVDVPPLPLYAAPPTAAPEPEKERAEIERLKAVALQAQNAAIDLAKENERLQNLLYDQMGKVFALRAAEQMRKQIAELKHAENERLREALKKYGRHLDDCALTLGGYQCTCGFNQQEVPR